MTVQDMKGLVHWLVKLALRVGIIPPFVLYILFIYAPVMFYHEAKCLEAGYPESQVTVGLSGYCIGIDGTVIDRVHKL